MNMLSKAVSAALLLGAAGTAAALPLSEYDASVVNVYFGGATATDNVLENLFLATSGGICTPGTISVYRAANQRVVFCRVENARVPGFPAAPGAKVAFHKESEGGSSNGVNPLIDVAFGRAHRLRWLDMAALRDAAACGTPAAVAATADLNGFNNYPACPLTRTPAHVAGSATFAVTGGITDNEPAIAFPAPGAAEIARLTTKAGLQIVFGVPVTLNLYRALQVTQGITARPGCDPAVPAQIDSPACVPTLSSAQVRSLYSGTITSWDSLLTPAGVPLASAPGVTAPTDSEVYVCRRVSTSGTQASFETFFLQQRCISGSQNFALPDDGSGIEDQLWVAANPNNGFVNAGPSSGNVRTCLNTMHTANRWALGVLSTETTAAQLVNFRYVALDGVRPSLETAANGSYQFVTENTLNRIQAGFPGAATGQVLTLLQYIENNIGRPALIRQLNTPFQNRPNGDGGVLAIAGGAIVPSPAPITLANVRTNPVSTVSRSPGGIVNNCAPPFQVRPQAAGL